VAVVVEGAEGRQAATRAGFHDLRHTFGTQAAQKLSPVALQSYMGHAHFSTTERYLHYVPAVGDAAKLTEVFGGGSDRQVVGAAR
jgi:integrase